MKIEIKDETLEIIKSHRLPSYAEIPNVGLYLEQTAKYINEFLEPIMDTAITGSMISNYVKKKLIANPVKKQYYREQIADLIVIAILKSVISLDKVQVLMQHHDADEPETLYDCFCSEFTAALGTVFGISAGERRYENSDDLQKLLGNIVITAAHKIYIDKMLNAMV